MNGGKPPAGDPGAVMALTTAHWGAQALFTANRLNVFATIAEGENTIPAVARACGTDERATALLLKACASLELLQHTDGVFSLAPAAAALLVPGSPVYLGNAIRYSDDLYGVWEKLEDSVREGGPVLATAEYTGDDEERTRHFVMGMHDRAMGIGRVLVDMVDLGGHSRLLDIGGGPGTYSALFTGHYPGLRSTVIDLPGVVAIAREIVADMPGGDRVDFLAGDFHSLDWPVDFDSVLISGVFHREREQACRDLIARAAAVLGGGGQLVVADVFTESGGCGPPMAALFGLNMLLTAPDGGVHDATAVAQWMEQAGFVETRVDAFPEPMPHRVVTGHLPV